MVINIGVTDDIDKIALFPATVDHILSAKGEKFHRVPPEGYILFSIADFFEKRKMKRKMKKRKKVVDKSALPC